MLDQFPLLDILDTFLSWVILGGIILTGFSVAMIGIAHLPIFAFLLDERREAWSQHALRNAAIGLGLILIALPMRNWIILHYFPIPTGLPHIPVTKPFPTLTPTKVQ